MAVSETGTLNCVGTTGFGPSAEQPEASHVEKRMTEVLGRFCRGAEAWDRALLTSALTADAELDPRRATEAWSVYSPRLIGRATIASILLGILDRRVDTTHTITESSARVDDGRARLCALVDIHHRLIADNPVGAHLTYHCTAQLVVADARWTLRRLEVETVRYRGDPAEIYCRASAGRRTR